MAFIFETISFKLTQKEVLYPLMGPSILNEGFLPNTLSQVWVSLWDRALVSKAISLKLATPFYACLSS